MPIRTPRDFCIILLLSIRSKKGRRKVFSRYAYSYCWYSPIFVLVRTVSPIVLRPVNGVYQSDIRCASLALVLTDIRTSDDLFTQIYLPDGFARAREQRAHMLLHGMNIDRFRSRRRRRRRLFAWNLEKVRETAIKCISRSRRIGVRFGKNSESFLSCVRPSVTCR